MQCSTRFIAPVRGFLWSASARFLWTVLTAPTTKRVLNFLSMKLKSVLTSKKALALAAVIGVAVAAAGYLALRRPALVPMERYIPAGALAYVEVDSLADLTRGLT